jgi:rsbT co-antagonist protein RsbR
MAAILDQTIPELSDPQRAALRDFWQVYDANTAELNAVLLDAARRIPEFAPVLASMSKEVMEQNQAEGRVATAEALRDGNWAHYLGNLRRDGAMYAQMGVSFTCWYELITKGFRKTLLRKLMVAHGDDQARAVDAIDAMDLFLDIALSNLGEAYLSTKESLIERQQEAIRELSTPVLQVMEGLLILPLVGVFDTHRALQLTEELLRNIRDRRARVVVMDITGVPIVDSKVANHFAQTVDAARLMGALVILTGLSAEIAQTLVSIGADMRNVVTYCDLESGLDAARAMLGWKMIRHGDPDFLPWTLPRGRDAR